MQEKYNFRGTCERCGGKQDLQFDQGWEGNCLNCGSIKVLDPLSLPIQVRSNPRRYTVTCLTAPDPHFVNSTYDDRYYAP